MMKPRVEPRSKQAYVMISEVVDRTCAPSHAAHTRGYRDLRHRVHTLLSTSLSLSLGVKRAPKTSAAHEKARVSRVCMSTYTREVGPQERTKSVVWAVQGHKGRAKQERRVGNASTTHRSVV